MNCPQTYFTKLQLASAIAVFTVVVVGIVFSQNVYAATGINRTINFQGKLVTSAGLNVADSTYSVIFAMYDRSSTGTALWSETQSVTTVDGIFRVSLGSSTEIPANFNFNWDGLYLGIKVGADAEMTPRIRMAAVPYAFNAEKVAGLTVTDENGVASTSGTLKIPNGKTISFGGAFTTSSGYDLTFTTTGNTTLGLGGNGSLTLVDTSTTQTITNKIIGSTGLTFTGATTDITTGTNQDFVLNPNGSGLIGLGTTSPSSFFHVYGGDQGGNALAILDQRGAATNDIFTASSAGLTKFVIGNTGNVGIGTTLTSSYNLDVTGTARFTGAITVASCTGCGGVGTNYWEQISGNGVSTGGVTLLGNATTDLLVGGIATSSAKFAVLNMVGSGIPTASVSAGLTGALYINASGTIATTAKQSLTLGGSTTGTISLKPGDFSNAVLTVSNNQRIGINIDAPSAVFDAYAIGSVLTTELPTSRFRDSNHQINASITSFRYNKFDTPILDITTGNTITNAANLYIQGAPLNIGVGSLTNSYSLWVNGGKTRFDSLVGIGTTAPETLLHLYDTRGGNASLIVDQRGATGDLFAASASGTTKFVVDRSGNVGIGSSNPTGYNLDVTGTARFTGAITVASCTGCGGVGASYWDQLSGIGVSDGGITKLGNTTSDLLVGGTATTSAKFAILNMSSSNFPVASISAQAGVYAPALSLSSNGSIQSVNMNTLTLGGNTTGNILLSPNNGTGYLNIGTSSVNAFQFDLTQAATKTLSLGVDTVADGILKLFSSGSGKTAPTIYTDSTGNLNFAAPSGSVKIGSVTSGNINLHLNSQPDVFLASKVIALSSSYTSINDFSFVRTLTASTNAISGGSVFKIIDNTTGSNATSTDDMLLINQATTNPNWAGNLINAQIGGTTKFKVSGTGTVAGVTVSPTTSYAALAVINSGVGDLITASAGAVTKFVVDRSGNVGIGTSNPSSAKLVVSESSAPAIDLAQLINTTGTSTTGVDGLQVDFQTAGTANNADNSGLRVNVTSNNNGTTTTLQGIYIGDLTSAEASSTETALKIGTGWDTGISIASGGISVTGGGLTLAGTGMTYSGSARPTKTLVLSAEYPGATLTASGSATITGSMTSDASPSATFGAGTNNWMNYYMWTSTQTSLHNYTIAVRSTVPRDFAAWNTTAIQVNFNTQLTTTDTNKLDVLVYRAGDTVATPLFYSQANVSSTVKQWKTVDVTSTALSTLVAGDTFVIYLKVYAKDNNYVQVGDIVLSYLAAF